MTKTGRQKKDKEQITKKEQPIRKTENKHKETTE